MEIGMKMLTELRAEGFIKNFEAYWSRKDGSLCPIELNITLLKDSNGNKAALSQLYGTSVNARNLRRLCGRVMNGSVL